MFEMCKAKRLQRLVNAPIPESERTPKRELSIER
jgi:hypothetical protein